MRLLLLIPLLAPAAAAQEPRARVVLHFDGSPLERVRVEGAGRAVHDGRVRAGAASLRVAPSQDDRYFGVTCFDLPAAAPTHLVAAVFLEGDRASRFRVRIDSPGSRAERRTAVVWRRLAPGWNELEVDLAPFRALRHAPMAMTAHVVYHAWDPDRCATLSPRVIETVIRGAIGFGGLLFSDDLDMQALEGAIPDRAAAALAAGCDVALNCWARMPDMVAMAERLPAAGHDCLRRLDAALAVCESAVDFATLAERRDYALARRDAALATLA